MNIKNNTETKLERYKLLLADGSLKIHWAVSAVAARKKAEQLGFLVVQITRCELTI